MICCNSFYPTLDHYLLSIFVQQLIHGDNDLAKLLTKPPNRSFVVLGMLTWRRERQQWERRLCVSPSNSRNRSQALTSASVLAAVQRHNSTRCLAAVIETSTSSKDFANFTCDSFSVFVPDRTI